MAKSKPILPMLEEEIKTLNVAIDCHLQAIHNMEKKNIPVLSNSPALIRCAQLQKQRHQKIITLRSMRETYRKAKALLDLA